MSYQLIDTVTPDVGAKTGAEKINNNAVQAQYQGGYFTATGTANAITLTSGTGAPTAYTAGQEVCFRANATNTGAATVNVDGLGIKLIKTESGADIPAGYLSTSADTRLRYDGVNFIANIPARVVLAATGRNLIINGDFSIWQRGTSQTTSGYGSDDRFSNEHVGSTKTVTRETWPLGDPDNINNNKYFSRTTVSSSAGAGNYVVKSHRIENVITTANREITVSFRAKADAAKNIALEFVQNFGTGGSPSAAVEGISVTTFALTTSWQTFTVTIKPPSIAGKVLGTDNNDSFNLNFWYDAGTNLDARTNSLGQQSGAFDTDSFQVEFGTVATDFEYVPPTDQLARCQRYFERIGRDGQTFIGSGYAENTTSVQVLVDYSEKRDIPSVTVNNPTSCDVGKAGVTATVSSLGSVVLPNLKHVRLDFNTSAVTAGEAVIMSTGPGGNASIDIDAEL